MQEPGSTAVNREEALHLLAGELNVLRSMSYQALADLVGRPHVLARKGADGAEYQIEVEVFPDSPRYPRGNFRVIASIDDGTFPASIKPVTRDFIMSPDGAFVGE